MTAFQDIRYAKSGETNIAYSTFGEGEMNVVLVWGFVHHLREMWDFEPSRKFQQGFGRFARVASFDRRGTGMSDPAQGAPPFEERMDDLRAVMDAAGMERAALVGIAEGVAMSILFAATYPERVSHLVSWGGAAKTTWAPDYEFATRSEDIMESMVELLAPVWGQGSAIDLAAPSAVDDDEARNFYRRLETGFATPAMALSITQMALEVDVRDVVPSVHVPTLVLHAARDRNVNIRHARWLAEHLPDARLVEIDSDDHNPMFDQPERIVGEVEEFLTGRTSIPEPTRALKTVLFTDIVDSTRTASELGDTAWRRKLEQHDNRARAVVDRHDGLAVKSTGDGFLATFDGPQRGITAAREMGEELAAIGIELRAGLHTGEVELIGDDIGGMGVHIAARVSSKAGAGEILVSRTVKDLVVGSDLRFEERGEHELKGVPDRWQLYSAVG